MEYNTDPICRLALNAISTVSVARVEDLFHHVLATLHDPSYREANSGALAMEWPRIPLPGWPDGDTAGAAEALAASAAKGRELARLLDPDTPVPGVTQGELRPETRRDRRPLHHRRAQHDRRRFRAHRRVGPLRHWRRRHAGPGPHRRARVHPGRSAPPSAMQYPHSAPRRWTYT